MSEDIKENIVSDIEEELHRDYDREVDSSTIGERVMAKLRDTDEVAYIRFASEYYKFRSVDDFRPHIAATLM